MSSVADSEDTSGDSDITSTYSSEGDVPLASITIYGSTSSKEKPRGILLSGKTTDDRRSASESSSSYKSDGDISCCNNEQYGSQQVTDDENPVHPVFLPSPPSMTKMEFENLLLHGIKDAGCIYPLDVQNFLPRPVRDMLCYLMNNGRTFLYVKSPAMTFGRFNEDKIVPNKVICDFFVFPPVSPVKVLTLVTKMTSCAKHYNSVLAQNLTNTVMEDTVRNFHLEHGVVGPEDWSDETGLKRAVDGIQQKALDTALPRSLDMSEEKQTSIVRVFLQRMVYRQQLSRPYLGLISKFVETAAYKEVKGRLEQEGVLILTGEAGEGKTTIGHQLCYDYHQMGYNIVFFSKKEDINWDVLKTTQLTLVVGDDVEHFPQEHMTQLEQLHRNIKLLMIVQSQYFETVEKHVPNKRETLDITYLRKRNMDKSKQEYLRMLQSGIPEISQDVQQLIISKSSVHSGFPKRLRQFKKYQHCIDAEAYFTNPMQYTSILYTAASNGDLRAMHLEKIDIKQVDINEELTNCIRLNDLKAFCNLKDTLVNLQRQDVRYNPDCTDLHGNTLLMMAIQTNQIEHAIVEVLIKDANVLVRNGDGNMAIHLACLRRFTDIVKILLPAEKTQKNLPGQDLRTPIMMAALKGDKELYEYLVDVESCELKGVDENGDTILHLACIGGNLDIVKSLIIRQGHFRNQRGQYGRTPLMVAAHWRHKEVFEWLLQQDCDILPQDFMMKGTISFGQIEQYSSIHQFLKTREYGIARIGHFAFGNIHENHLKLHIENKVTTMVFVDENGMDLLHWAANIGHLDLAAVLLAKDKMHVNSKNTCGKTPIMLAAASGHGKILDLLLEKGGDLNMRDESYTGLLHFACQGGNPAIVHTVLHHGVTDVNSSDDYGKTPLSYAVENGDLVIFDTILSHHGDLSVVDVYKNNLLHLASKEGNLVIIQQLLSTGQYDINTVNENCRTPLLEAAYRDFTDVCTHLIGIGADLRTQDREGNDVLLVASIKGNSTLTKAILDRGEIVVFAKDTSGKTAIMKAAEKGHDKIYFALKNQRNYKPTERDDTAGTILHSACTGNSVSIVHDILSQNIIDINSRDKNKRTAVMMAAEKGHRDVFNLLVKWECDLSAFDAIHRTILHFACIGGQEDIVKTIFSWNKHIIDSRDVLKRTAVMEAAENGHRGVFDMLVSEGCELLGSDDREYNILHYACSGGNADIVKSVLSKNLFAIDSKDCRGRTPIMWAVERGHKRVFDLLLGKKCDLSVVDFRNWNILHCACYGGNVGIVQYLLSRNIVNIKIKDNNGRTPLKIAQYREHTDIVALFEQRGH